MANGFAPVGTALPSRRDVPVVAAADTSFPGGPGSIIIPAARDRLLEIFERMQLPQEVQGTLEGTITGDLRLQQMLFQAMIDTWPHLQKALGELKRAVRKAPWKVTAWSPRGEKPDAKAEKLAKDVENAVWGMRPDPITGLRGFEGTIEELAMGYFLGHQVMEIHWKRTEGIWLPEGTKYVPPRFYGYPYDAEGVDRLMLDPTGGKSGTFALTDFPKNRFLVAVNGGHSGHPTVAAPLRALTGYWLASVYGLKWFMNYAQLFGQPIRWANYTAGDVKAKAEIQQMMERIGSAGWGIFPDKTALNFVESGKSGASLPQRELLALADEQVDVFILGQTLTSSQGDKGSQALGTVHMEVRQEVVEGVCDFVGEIMTHQFAPAVVALNSGARTDTPGIWAVFEKPKDEKGMAERDNTLGVGTKVPVGKAWFYERHGIPVPAEGEELFEPIAADPAVPPEKETPGLPAPNEKKPGKFPPKKVEASASDALPTVDRLSAAVLEGLTGVTEEWLSPVRPFFERLAALAMAKHVTDEDFEEALRKAQAQLPELFDILDTQALEEAFENAIGTAVLAGSVSRYE